MHSSQKKTTAGQRPPAKGGLAQATFNRQASVVQPVPRNDAVNDLKPHSNELIDLIRCSLHDAMTHYDQLHGQKWFTRHNGARSKLERQALRHIIAQTSIQTQLALLIDYLDPTKSHSPMRSESLQVLVINELNKRKDRDSELSTAITLKEMQRTTAEDNALAIPNSWDIISKGVRLNCLKRIKIHKALIYLNEKASQNQKLHDSQHDIDDLKTEISNLINELNAEKASLINELNAENASKPL